MRWGCRTRIYRVVVIYSPAHNLVFLKTIKTAGTSIEMEISRHVDDEAVLTPIIPEEAERVAHAGRGAQNHDRRAEVSELTLRRLVGGVKRRQWPRVPLFWHHITASEVRSRIGDQQWSDATKVCVVRNPWEVFASRFQMERDRRADIDTVDDMVSRIGVTSNWPIYTIDDEIVVDHVVRYEDLGHLSEVLLGVGIEIGELPRAKASGSRREPLEQRHVDLVADVCRQEIEHFGYRP